MDPDINLRRTRVMNSIQGSRAPPSAADSRSSPVSTLPSKNDITAPGRSFVLVFGFGYGPVLLPSPSQTGSYPEVVGTAEMERDGEKSVRRFVPRFATRVRRRTSLRGHGLHDRHRCSLRWTVRTDVIGRGLLSVLNSSSRTSTFTLLVWSALSSESDAVRV